MTRGIVGRNYLAYSELQSCSYIHRFIDATRRLSVYHTSSHIQAQKCFISLVSYHSIIHHLRPHLQPRPLLQQRIILRTTLQGIPITNNLLDILETSDVEQDIKVSQQRPHDVTHAVVAHDAEAPNPETANEDELRAESEGLEHVAGAANAAVVHDVDLVSDGCGMSV